MSLATVQTAPMGLATVAHELRGPVGALETASELLDRDFDLLDSQQVKVMVSSIHRRALWLRGLMENLLCAATADDGRLQIHQRPVEIRALVEETATLMEPLFKRKEQRVRVRARPMLPLVSGDEHRLSQVMLNLLSNANKYSGIGTTVEVVVTVRAEHVRITVADRGPGVPREHVGRLFDAYERAGRTGGDGLGIGLAVVRSIIEAHGGRVGYGDRAGGGALFWVELATAGAARPMTAGPIELEGVG